MRTSWWACIFVGILTAVTYHHFDQRSLPTVSPAAAEPSEQHAPDQEPEQPPAHKDEARLQDVASAPAGLEPDRLPDAQKDVRL